MALGSSAGPYSRVSVTAFGPNPDGPGTLLRVWDQTGAAGKLVMTLPKGLRASKATPVNLRGERAGDPLVIDNSTLTIATPDNPMVQLGGFNFGAFQRRLEPFPPVMLGWVTSNHWETNYRAHQPGWVYCRYRLRSYPGPFVESGAHRFADEAAEREILSQHMGEPSSARTLPREGALFRIASPDLRLLRCRRESPHTALLEVINASDRPVSSEIFCGGEEWKAAWLCTADGEAKTSVPLAAGTLPVSLQPRQTAVLRLDGT